MTKSNLREEKTEKKSNVYYRFENGVGYGTLPNGMTFLFDEDKYDLIKQKKWYTSLQGRNKSSLYIIDRYGRSLHNYLVDCPKGYEVDHISLDTLDNRLCNLRICTHQQNQCNQPLQRNNTSGVTGVRFNVRRQKYVSRIKIGQHEIFLGGYPTIIEATQARNVGMECMFGEYGQYNNVPPAPEWIREKVTNQCKRFAELSICKAFLLSKNE